MVRRLLHFGAGSIPSFPTDHFRYRLFRRGFGNLRDKAKPQTRALLFGTRGILDLEDGCAITRPIDDGLLFRDFAWDLVTLRGIS